MFDDSFEFVGFKLQVTAVTGKSFVFLLAFDINYVANPCYSSIEQ